MKFLWIKNIWKKYENNNNLVCKQTKRTNTTQKKTYFSHKKPWLMTYVWGKLCGFIHYNMQCGCLLWHMLH